MKNDSLLKTVVAYVDLLVLFFIIFDLGYKANLEVTAQKALGLIIVTCVLLALNMVRYRFSSIAVSKNVARVSALINATVLGITIVAAMLSSKDSTAALLVTIRPVIEIGLVGYFVFRLLSLVRYVYEIYYNPAIVFVSSFLVLILVGAFLLMIPRATVGSISFLDALFTATSAVCVTGLIVVDTATTFTTTGQAIIMGLIQMGGLGILTFTSFFAFFFKGSTSFKEGLNVKDFMSQESLGDVFRTAVNVVIITLGIEFIGVLLIYWNIADVDGLENKWFFAFFHGISAFCNAGFSTLTNGLNENVVKFKYGMQWIIMALIVLGGIGHGVLINLVHYLKSRLKFNYTGTGFLPDFRVVTINTKIVITTTTVLIVLGFLLVGVLEYNHILLEHDSTFGKITAAMFHAITPRTAGFNTSDFTLLQVPTILVIILLMWIGGSPGSTAGGIKTSTFALAILNIIAIAKGKSRIQIFRRRVSSESTSRAFAILFISLLCIGLSTLGMLLCEPSGTDFMKIAFESFSAYCTVGLSLNLTPTLTSGSKCILIVTMFVGRIGMLNLLFGILRELNHQFYEYPKENILIN